MLRTWNIFQLIFGEYPIKMSSYMVAGRINTIYGVKIHLVLGLEIWIVVISVQYLKIGFKLWIISRNDSCPFLMWYFRHWLELFSGYGREYLGWDELNILAKIQVFPFWSFNILRTWNIFQLVFGEYPIRISAYTTHIG